MGNKTIEFTIKCDGEDPFKINLDEDSLKEFLDIFLPQVNWDDVRNNTITEYNFKDDLLEFKANRCLAMNHSRIYPRTMERYSDFDELYDDYLSKTKDNHFYLLEDNKIICFDTTASGSDKYWCEEFPIKDYEYANKWLNGEIEYSDYLEQKNEEDIEL